MSVFQIRFVRAAMPSNERDAGLEGEGTITARREGLSVRALQRRRGLAALLATIVASITLVFVLFALMLGLDAMGIVLPTKLAVVIGLVALAVSGLGAQALFERVLPRRARDVLVPWPYVVATRPSATSIQIVTTASELAGTWTFEAAEPAVVAAALEAAR